MTTLDKLLAGLKATAERSVDYTHCHWLVSGQPENLHYTNDVPESGIAFSVEKTPLAGLQVLDPRVVRIAPGACNEKHRHAHESLFVVLQGEAKIFIDNTTHAVQKGEIACVPRWAIHQTCNPSPLQPLVLLAITDFGLTSAVLGDYDSHTRLKIHGRDAL